MSSGCGPQHAIIVCGDGTRHRNSKFDKKRPEGWRRSLFENDPLLAQDVEDLPVSIPVVQGKDEEILDEGLPMNCRKMTVLGLFVCMGLAPAGTIAQETKNAHSHSHGSVPGHGQAQ